METEDTPNFAVKAAEVPVSLATGLGQGFTVLSLSLPRSHRLYSEQFKSFEKVCPIAGRSVKNLVKAGF